jgi:hypothetical protein
MSTQEPENGRGESDEEAMAEGYVPDSRLPEDLRPDPEDNPLAVAPEEGAGPDDDGAGESETVEGTPGPNGTTEPTA